MKVSPLAGIKILDFSRLLPGPFATQLLSDLGAQVTKVENLESGGDGLRHYPPLSADGTSAMFHALNRGKRSIAISFREERETLCHLIKEADVCVESFRPGTFEKMMGVGDVRDILAENKQLILCRISGYGSKCQDPGHDLNFVASSGLLGMMREPSALPVQVGDLLGGSYPAALQIVAALYARRRDDPVEARLIDVNIAAGALASLSLPLARLAASGESIGNGNDMLSGEYAAYSIYVCKGGEQLCVAALEPHFWDSFCRVMGLNDCKGKYLLRDRSTLAATFREQTIDYWEKALLLAGVPVSRIIQPEDAIDHLEQRTQTKLTLGLSITAPGGGITTLRVPRMPLSLGAPKEVPGPALGEHNLEPPFLK
jgi:crotonobetainyl-CoA:carnitine CoA-transferase CaiB-like acyl-CoA transferase